MTKQKRKPEIFMMRFTDNNGSCSPADIYTLNRIKAKGYRKGDLSATTLKKTRKYSFHKHVHNIGTLIGENIERFNNVVSSKSGKPDAHKVIKTIQWEGDIYCEHLTVMMPNVGMVDVKIPISISFDSMEQGEFEEFIDAVCEYVSRIYWPDCTPDEIAKMAGMVDQS